MGLSCGAVDSRDAEEASADAAGPDSQLCGDAAGTDSLASAALSEVVCISAVAFGTALSAVVAAASAFGTVAHVGSSFAFSMSARIFSISCCGVMSLRLPSGLKNRANKAALAAMPFLLEAQTNVQQ